MDYDHFMTLCEKHAVKIYLELLEQDNPELLEMNALKERAEKMAEQRASKQEEYQDYYDMAMESIMKIFRNPEMFIKMPGNKKSRTKPLPASILNASAA